MKASIYNTELEFISNSVLDFESLETGGDLFGYWDKNGNPVIQFVTGPGEATTRTEISFYQDIPYLHKCVRYLHNNYGLEQIGSWHSHHKMDLPRPSSGDEETMRNCLLNCNIENFVIVICNILRDNVVNINGFVFSKLDSPLYVEIKWVTLLAKENPMRKHIEKDVRFFRNPRNKRAIFKVKKEYIDEFEVINQNLSEPEKPNLPKDYFFNTKEGQDFLFKEFEKIKKEEGISNVELVLNNDKTISITFNLDEKDFEVNYPISFSNENPKPIIIEKPMISSKIEIKEENVYNVLIDDFFSLIRKTFFKF